MRADLGSGGLRPRAFARHPAKARRPVGASPRGRGASRATAATTRASGGASPVPDREGRVHDAGRLSQDAGQDRRGKPFGVPCSPTCCGMPAASSSPTTGRTRAPCNTALRQKVVHQIIHLEPRVSYAHTVKIEPLDRASVGSPFDLSRFFTIDVIGLLLAVPKLPADADARYLRSLGLVER